MTYIWLIIVIFLAIIEMATVNLVSIWFVASGLIALVISLFTKNVLLQSAVFVILGIIFMPLTKKIEKKIIPEKQKTNYDRIIGMNGKVIQKISPTELGEIKVDGKIWRAKSNTTIEEGEYAKIVAIDSTKLIVERMEK